jgi:hypothetical protein
MEKIIFTSIPKSGTHLLLRFFDRTGFKQAGPYGEIFFDEQFYDFVKELKSGEYSAWHYHWDGRLAKVIRDIGAKVVFLYRDPRAHICSNLDFIMKTPMHPLFNLFTNHVQTNRERIRILIEGFSENDYSDHSETECSKIVDPAVPSAICGASPLLGGRGPISKKSGGVNALYWLFSNWLAEPNVYRVRFEDIIGSKGGGSTEKQLQVVRELMEFTGIPQGEVSPQKVADFLFDEQSHTFRKGQINSWSEHFTPELHDLFLQESRELLGVWGYEPSYSAKEAKGH